MSLSIASSSPAEWQWQCQLCLPTNPRCIVDDGVQSCTERTHCVCLNGRPHDRAGFRAFVCAHLIRYLPIPRHGVGSGNGEIVSTRMVRRLPSSPAEVSAMKL